MKRDLDWIVMKALDKDRNRHYSTAGAMAEDVSRFLMNQAAEEAATKARLEVEGFNDRLNSTTVLLASGRAHADSQRWQDAYEAYTEATEILPKYFWCGSSADS